MNWKTKALIQKAIAWLPSKLSYPTYYWVQRHFGTLSNPTPTEHLEAVRGLLSHIQVQGQSVEGKHIVEVGTGRRIIFPLMLWVCGASKIITVDLNPYLKWELIGTDLAYLRHHADSISADFGKFSPTFPSRWKQLVEFKGDLPQLLALCDIVYLAPADASQLDLPDQSIDFHISSTVFEHIPSHDIQAILREGRRLLKPNGLTVHFIDFSDHFAYADPSLTSINFLQFSDRQWSFYAGNRYMYHNRLRVDEFDALFSQAGFKLLIVQPTVDAKAVALIESGFNLHSRFRGKSTEIIATRDAWIVATPN